MSGPYINRGDLVSKDLEFDLLHYELDLFTINETPFMITAYDYSKQPEGSLIFKSSNPLVDFDIDANGDLYVSGVDADYYTINEQGELIYTIP